MIEDTIGYGLLRAHKATRSTIGPVLAELGLHPGQELLLSQLWRAEGKGREPGLDQAELVARLGVEAPTVTKTLQRLERAGYVRREPLGGRRWRVLLTDEGRALRRPVEAAWRAADRKLTRALTPAQRSQLREILTGLPRPET